MCGIVGVASARPNWDREWLSAARDAMKHRGPDAGGEWWSHDSRVGLGHRRLSIIDLSPAGHQPMLDVSGELCIAFNGEIYNFGELRAELVAKGCTFKSHSDTEVILAAYREWDLDCLDRLNGMFAFALYDSRSSRLFLARDRAGEKPLFYTVSEGTFYFASELKALLANDALPRRIDPVGLDCYLAMGYVPGQRCILEGMRKLPPAHAMTFDVNSGATRVWRYWEPPVASALETTRPESDLLDELDHLLADVVKHQLVADVPVGVLLSGGVDSSLVTAMAVRSRPAVKTFTVRFPGYGAYDETPHARLIANHFQTDHVELEATDTSVDLLPMLAAQFDEPVVDSSMVPTYLVSELVRQHCTVALGGDGGDELFGGYHRYDRFLWMDSTLRWIPLAARKGIARTATDVLPVGFKGRNWLEALGADLRCADDLPAVGSMFDRRTRQQLYPGLNAHGAAERILRERIVKSADVLQRATRTDFENYLAEDILVKVDRASMLNSLEVRAPILDRRVIDFAFGKVPSTLKATPNSRKILLKKLAQRILPTGFDQHRKQGFSIPLASWLRGGPWLDYFKDVLLSESSDFFDRRTVQKLLDGHVNGRSNSERLFALVMFELWRRHYRL